MNAPLYNKIKSVCKLLLEDPFSLVNIDILEFVK